MFDFLTGLVDIILGIFQAIQDLINGVIGIFEWLFGVLTEVWQYWTIFVAMIPSELLLVLYPLMMLAFVGAILKAVSFVKSLIPFN